MIPQASATVSSAFYCGLALFLFATLLLFFVLVMVSFTSPQAVFALLLTPFPTHWPVVPHVHTLNPPLSPLAPYVTHIMSVAVVLSSHIAYDMLS
ncbi:hypothetical protein AUM95_22860, partial [Cronobacter sakazakii]